MEVWIPPWMVRMKNKVLPRQDVKWEWRTGALARLRTPNVTTSPVQPRNMPSEEQYQRLYLFLSTYLLVIFPLVTLTSEPLISLGATGLSRKKSFLLNVCSLEISLEIRWIQSLLLLCMNSPDFLVKSPQHFCLILCSSFTQNLSCQTFLDL